MTRVETLRSNHHESYYALPAPASVYDNRTRNPTPTRSTNTNVITQRPRRLANRITRVHRRVVNPHSPGADAGS